MCQFTLPGHGQPELYNLFRWGLMIVLMILYFCYKKFSRCIHGSLLFYSWLKPLTNSGLLYPEISYWTPFLLILRYFWITSVMFQTEPFTFCITEFCIISVTSRSSYMVSQLPFVLIIPSNYFSLANLVEMVPFLTVPRLIMLEMNG